MRREAIECLVCAATFPLAEYGSILETLKGVVNHVKIEHPEVNITKSSVTCIDCNKDFANLRLMLEHVASKHEL
jgi:hypothetical protein